jgi:hypothetical protein
MAKHPGDDGDWNLDSAAEKPMSIRERCNTDLGITSDAVIRAMQVEEAFLRTVKPFTTKRFTDRRPIPGRGKLLP